MVNQGTRRTKVQLNTLTVVQKAVKFYSSVAVTCMAGRLFNIESTTIPNKVLKEMVIEKGLLEAYISSSTSHSADLLCGCNGMVQG